MTPNRKLVIAHDIRVEAYKDLMNLLFRLQRHQGVARRLGLQIEELDHLMASISSTTKQWGEIVKNTSKQCFPGLRGIQAALEQWKSAVGDIDEDFFD